MKQSRWNDAANRLCTGHRASRPQIKVDCPKCAKTIDTEARLWIDCPYCDSTFNRRTSTVLQDLLTPLDNQHEDK